MVRVIVVLVSLTLACYPAQAIAPAVMIAREIVKQIIFDFVQARVEDGIRASFGPCKADLAEDAITQSRTLTGLLRGSGGGGMSGLSALGGAGNLGSLSSLGAAGGQVRAVRNLQNVQSTAGSVAGAANLASAAGGGDGALAIGQIAGTVSGVAGTAAGVAGSAASVTGAAGAVGAMGAMPNMAGMPNVAGLGGMNALVGQAGGSAEAMAAMSQMMPSAAGLAGAGGMGGADMQQAMAMMQQMMNAKPLDAAEMNELAQILESFGKISEAIQPGSACSADDYKRQFTRVSTMSMQPGMPQAGAMMNGVLRMMYTSFKDMQRSTAEAEQVFSQMNAEDRAEYVQTTVAEMKDQPPEGRRAFLAMIDSGMLGMPADMKTAFRKQLAS